LAIENNLEDMLPLLETGKLNEGELRETDETGRTAVHWAVVHGNKEMLSALAKGGADLDLVNGDGDTPAHQALATEKVPIAAHLISEGASVTCKDSAEITVLEKAAELSRDCFQLLADANQKRNGASSGYSSSAVAATDEDKPANLARAFSDGGLRWWLVVVVVFARVCAVMAAVPVFCLLFPCAWCCGTRYGRLSLKQMVCFCRYLVRKSLVYSCVCR
jgi:Ankyrin repeats (3 copies)